MGEISYESIRSNIDWLNRNKLAATGKQMQALLDRCIDLEHRLYPGQGEAYDNEVERQRYVIEELQRIAEEQAAALESVKALHHRAMTKQFEWSRRNNAEFGILVRELGEALKPQKAAEKTEEEAS